MSDPRLLSITSTGKRVDLLSPTPEAVELEHIAHALSGICRFGGSTPKHYSVAQHAVLVSRYIQEQGGSQCAMLAGLHHDSAEAYVGDMVAGIKHDPRMQRFRDLEDFWICCIWKALGIEPLFQDYTVAKAVQDADLAVLGAEGRDLFDLNEKEVLLWTKGIKPYQRYLARWPRELAKDMFLEHHHRLCRWIKAGKETSGPLNA